MAQLQRVGPSARRWPTFRISRAVLAYTRSGVGAREDRAARKPICDISRRRVLATKPGGKTAITIRPGAGTHRIRMSFTGQPASCSAQKKAPAGWPRRGSSAQLVMRASRNDVAVDADAQPVVVLILDGVASGRLGCAGQGRIGHDGVLRCSLQLLVDHIEAHVEPRCEVVLGPGTDRPEVPVVAALAGVHLSLGERDRTADGARGGHGARADGRGGLRLADRPI